MKQLLPLIPRWQMLGLVAILLVSFTLQFYHNTKKTHFHVDENFSLDVIMNAPDYFATSHKLDTWMTAKEFLTANRFIGKTDKKKLLEDFIQLRMNTGDSSHTNLYYLLLRLTIWTGVDNLEEYKWRGWALNFVLFALGMLFLMCLFNLLYPDKPWLVLLSTFLYAISVASSAQVLFIRPYQLFGTALIMLSFYIIQALQKSEPNQDDFIKIALASFFALSSYYYSIIFIGLFGFAIIGYSLRFGQPKRIGSFLLAAFAGYVIAEIFYPYYTYGIIFAPNKHISHLASPLSFTYFNRIGIFIFCD